MRINRRSVALGLTLGVLAGGAGGALASTSAPTPWPGAGAGAWGGYGYGAGSGPGWGGPGCSGWRGGLGYATVGRAAVTAAAGYLGLTKSELRSRLASGTTLADIATSRHRSVSSLERAIGAAIRRSVLADTSLTASQQTAIIAQAKRRIDAIIHSSWPMGGRGWLPGDYGPLAGA